MKRRFVDSGFERKGAVIRSATTARRLLLGTVLALSSVIFCSGVEAVAQSKIPKMTIVIYNNSQEADIYPVLSFPGQTPDKWLQAFFEVKTADLGTKRYPSARTTRMYVNCCADGERGIPPGGSVTIKLPLYSPLVAKIDPSKPGQLIEWWQGGNINLYESPTKKEPPKALRALWADTEQKSITFEGGPPACGDTSTCHIHIYSTPNGNPPSNSPQQLAEFTLGAAPENGKADDPYYLFDPHDVDYDLSYVNSAYLPVVMEPYGNDLIGYIGVPTSIPDFKKAINKFLESDLARGWPLYLDDHGKVIQGKVPSVLEILTISVANAPKQDNGGTWINPPKFKPAPDKSQPMTTLINLWRNCQGKDSEATCKKIKDVTALVRANFDNYLKNYGQQSWGCDKREQPPLSQNLTELQLLQHLYGWTPFNEHCATTANLLQDTPKQDYQKVKNEFDKLQYSTDITNGKYGPFDPYVALVHGPTFINAPNAYAYSVDDTVGNMQTRGTGLIIAVGGTKNLPNPDHVTPDVHFNFGYGSEDKHFVKYGRCVQKPDTEIKSKGGSFAVPIGVTKKVSDCLITFEDGQGQEYQFQIGANFQPSTWPSKNSNIGNDKAARAPVADSCKKNTPDIQDKWCKYIYVYRQKLDDAHGTVQYDVEIRGPPP